jgi:hypothetical protein
MEVCVFARPLAELAAPPTMRHHAERSATINADLMLADLRLSHHTLVQQSLVQFDKFFARCRTAAGPPGAGTREIEGTPKFMATTKSLRARLGELQVEGEAGRAISRPDSVAA